MDDVYICGAVGGVKARVLTDIDSEEEKTERRNRTEVRGRV
jgi:hypothetical protein